MCKLAVVLWSSPVLNSKLSMIPEEQSLFLKVSLVGPLVINARMSFSQSSLQA